MKNAVYDGSLFYAGGSPGQNLRTGSNEGNRIYFDPSRLVPTANENRPVNMAVNILIKAYD